MTTDEDQVSSLHLSEWTDNEQRLFGGFLTESRFDEGALDVIQAEVPVGVQRSATALDEAPDTDLSLDDVLASRTHSDGVRGFRTAKELANKWGFSKASYTANVDCLLVHEQTVFVIEMKTRSQRIEGMHDVYEGFGQVLMNHDRFVEDYPSIATEATVRPLLLAEDSSLDLDLIRDSFQDRGVGFFDPTRGGLLIPSTDTCNASK